MLPSLDFHCFSVFFTSVALWLVWMPVIAFVAMAFGVWRKTDGKQYSIGRRWSLITPTLICAEIMFLAAWHERHRYDGTAFDKIEMLFLLLFPLSVFLIWRLRHCWLFATLLCLAQIWFGFAVIVAIGFNEAPALRMN